MRTIVAPTPRILRRRHRRRVREREKRHRRRGGKQVWPLTLKRLSFDLRRIYAPADIDINDGIKRQATLRFCQRIRQAYLHDDSSIILDFSKTLKIAAPGMLIVIAEIDRAQRMRSGGKQVMRCKLPDPDTDEKIVVRQVLDQLELVRRLDHPPIHQDGEEFHETVRHWRYATGTRVDDAPGNVLEQHEGRIASALMTKMQIGLSEALINSLHHAYRSARGDGCDHFKERRWWMFTHEVDGMLQVMVCDLGMGIPRSLPITWDRGILKKLRSVFIDDHHDVAAIKSALVLGESSTGDEHRGKGLPQIWNATQAASDGVVGIMSGNAYVAFRSSTGEESGAYASNLLGTLISWRVPVEASGDESDG